MQLDTEAVPLGQPRSVPREERGGIEAGVSVLVFGKLVDAQDCNKAPGLHGADDV